MAPIGPSSIAIAVLVAASGCLAPAGSLTTAGAVERLPAFEVEAASVVAANPYRDRETDVAIDPLDPDHIAILYNERQRPPLTGDLVTSPVTPRIIEQALAVSHDGGATWTTSILPSLGHEAPPTSKWSLFCGHGDPNVFFDVEGLLHIVTIAISCGGPGLTTVNGIVHATTPDDGATWSEPDLAWVVPGSAAIAFNDRQWAAYDGATGRIGVAWTAFYAAFNKAALTATFSYDGGRTWTHPEEIEANLLVVENRNYLVHTTWGLDGRFHVSGSGCLIEGAPLRSNGGCLVHFAGLPGGPWSRTTMPLEACPGLPEGARFGYAASAFDLQTGRVFVVGDLVGGPGVAAGTYPPAGACLFVSPDGGETWPRAVVVGEKASHPWVASTDGGRAIVVHLEVEGDLVRPMATLYDPDLTVVARTPLGPAYDGDHEDDGNLDHGDYDAMTFAQGRLVWALTHPREDAPRDGPADLDVRAYRARLRE